MQILIPYYTHKRGGFCKRLYRLINALSDAGHEVTYATLDAPPDGAIGSGVEVLRIPLPLQQRKGILFWALFFFWLPFFLTYVALVRKPQRIVVFGPYYSFAAWGASVIGKAPIILFVRSLPFKINSILKKPNALSWGEGYVDRLGLRSAGRVIFMTESMAKEANDYLARPLKGYSVLPNDLPSTSKKENEEPTFEIITCGVLDRRKNIDVLIDACRLLSRRCLIVGDGLEKSRLEEKCKDLSTITFTGWVEDPGTLLHSASLYVHPALHEGVSNALLEALASGIPVLVSDIPEHRELFQGAEEVLFPFDLANILAQKIEAFFKDPLYHSQVIEASRKTAERLSFDWNARAISLVEDTGNLG